MSLSLELKSNIIIFRIKNINDKFMIDMLCQTDDSVSSPDGMTGVTVFDTEAIAEKAFESMKTVIASFNFELNEGEVEQSLPLVVPNGVPVKAPCLWPVIRYVVRDEVDVLLLDTLNQNEAQALYDSRVDNGLLTGFYTFENGVCTSGYLNNKPK